LANGDQILAGETEFGVTLKSPGASPATGTARKTWTKERLNKKTPGNLAEQQAHASPIVLDEAQRLAMQTFVIGPPQGADSKLDELTMAVPMSFLDSPASIPPQRRPRDARPTTGLRFISPPSGFTRPLDLARALTPRPDFYMLINLQNMETEARSYFLSPIQGKRFTHVNESMVLVSSRDDIDCFELFRRAWGRDALIGVLSRASKERIAATIRNYENSYRHPTTLRVDIEKSPPEGVALMFAGIDAVLLESESVDGWSLILNQSVDLDLSSLGIKV
jgi:hypothetical protein